PAPLDPTRPIWPGPSTASSPSNTGVPSGQEKQRSEREISATAAPEVSMRTRRALCGPHERLPHESNGNSDPREQDLDEVTPAPGATPALFDRDHTIPASGRLRP